MTSSQPGAGCVRVAMGGGGEIMGVVKVRSSSKQSHSVCGLNT